jgi:predicted transcriptional regulator
MPRQEFIDLVQEIKTCGIGREMTKKDFLWLFEFYEKRTSGNVWRINDYLHKEKMIVVPSYQSGWIYDTIELKEKDKVKIKKGDDSTDEFDPINRLSILEASVKTPVSVKRDAKIDEAYLLLWQNDFTQLPIMNDDRTVLGIITWQTIAKGLITEKKSDCVKDFMSDKFTVLEENTPLFDAIKEVIKTGVVFVRDKEKKIKGPVTPSDLNEEFIEQIEPFILLEQIENYIRLLLDDKIILEDIQKLITIDDGRSVNSISDMTFGEYLMILENQEIWQSLSLPFDKTNFIKNLHKIRIIRNGVMHFHPDKISKTELEILRKSSEFLEEFLTSK